MSQAESLPAPFHFDAVIADKGYDSDLLRELLAAQQVVVVIPSRSYRKQPWDYDRVRYRERNIVERFINKIKWYRRIFTRYEKLARRYMAFLHLAATLIWLEQNVNGSSHDSIPQLIHADPPVVSTSLKCFIMINFIVARPNAILREEH